MSVRSRARARATRALLADIDSIRKRGARAWADITETDRARILDAAEEHLRGKPLSEVFTGDVFVDVNLPVPLPSRHRPVGEKLTAASPEPPKSLEDALASGVERELQAQADEMARLRIEQRLTRLEEWARETSELAAIGRAPARWE